MELDSVMSRSRRSWKRCLRTVTASLLLAGCSGDTTHPVCGFVLAAAGTVTIDGRPVFVSHGTSRGSQLCPGSILRTSTASNAQIACLSNTLLELTERSTLKIDSLSLWKDGNETEDEIEARSMRCHFSAGTLTIAYQGAEGVSEFVAVTPHGTLTAKFSCVVRMVIDDQTAHISCATGTVAFEPSNGRPGIRIEAGNIAESSARWTAIKPAAATAAGQQEIASSLDVERRLATLAMTRRATLPWAP